MCDLCHVDNQRCDDGWWPADLNPVSDREAQDRYLKHGDSYRSGPSVADRK